MVSTILKANYNRAPLAQPIFSFALVSPTPRAITLYTVDDTFGPTQSPRSSQHPSRKARSPHVKKPYLQHIFYIEPHLVHIKDPLALAIHLVHIKDPLALAMEVLPPNWHFLPKAPEKSIKFYKSILIQENSP